MQKIILIADDDNDDIDLLSEAIREEDSSCHCLRFSGAFELLDFLSGSFIKPSVIFIDINMPRMNGKECLKRIADDTRFSSTPVIMCSTSKNLQEIGECRDLGASYYFSKPSRWAEWKMEINKILKDFLYTPVSKAV